jgi:dipeptidase E
MAERHIVAIGGHSFDEPWTLPLDEYVLALTGRPRPRLLFLGQASAESPEYVASFYRRFSGRATISDLSLFLRDGTDPRQTVLDQDAIFVGGGNTANMLAIWRVHGVDAALREAWERGIVLFGVSAGMICWFERSVTDSFGPLAPLHDGLGLLPGSACPHYDGEPERRPTYTRLVREGFAPGYAADDFAAIHFAGTDLAACVAVRDGARVYRVEPGGETALETRLLGS